MPGLPVILTLMHDTDNGIGKLRWIGGLAFAVLAMALFFTLRTPGHLYVKSGTFTDCPSRPSCVSSVATNDTHGIAPIRVRGNVSEAMSMLAEHITTLPGASIEHLAPGYLHAVFISPKMRFRDDLELRVDDDRMIQVRSISRFGYRDFGINRDRVEALRSWLAAAEQSGPNWATDDNSP